MADNFREKTDSSGQQIREQAENSGWQIIRELTKYLKMNRRTMLEKYTQMCRGTIAIQVQVEDLSFKTQEIYLGKHR